MGGAISALVQSTIKDVMTIQTTVTKEHIENGKRKNNRCCPIALSFKNHKDVAHVSIFDDHAWLFMKKKKGEKVTIMKEFNFTEEMKNFVKKFDNEEKVEPQSFTFDDALLNRISQC